VTDFLLPIQIQGVPVVASNNEAKNDTELAVESLKNPQVVKPFVKADRVSRTPEMADAMKAIGKEFPA
jgi:hypothetical protein